MVLRELVTGSDVCTPGDGGGPSNAAGALADTLLGRGAKTQQRLREVPTACDARTARSVHDISAKIRRCFYDVIFKVLY